MKQEFCIIHSDYVVEGGRLVVRLWGRTREGKSALVLDRSFRPYFYVHFEGSGAEMQEKIMGLELEGERPVSAEPVNRNILGKPAKLMKVSVAIPASVPKFRELVKVLEGVKEEYEYAIPFHKRYLIDMKLRPMGWAEVEGRDGRKQAGIDIVIEAAGIKPKGEEVADASLFRVLSFSIGMQGEKLASVSIAGSGGFSKTISGSEKKVLEGFVAAVNGFNPDFIVGYDTDRHEFVKLSSKAVVNKARLGIGRDGSEPAFERRGYYSSAEVAGRAHIDLLGFVENILSPSMSSELLTLESVAAELAGAKKAESKAELALKLAERLLPQIFEISNLVGQNPFDASRMAYSQLVESLLMREAFESGEVILNRPKSDEIAKRMHAPSYEGGYVHPPLQGLHQNIALFDFASLYPSITITHNISPESIPPEEIVAVREDGKIKIVPVGKLVDDIMEKQRGDISRIGDSDILRVVNGLNVFSFDSKFRIEETTPTAIIRNNTRREIYQIKMRGGRTVNVTGDHNVFSLRNGNLVCVKTKDLRKNDFIAIPRRVRTKERMFLNIIDLMKDYDRGPLSMYHLHLDDLPLLLSKHKDSLAAWLRKNGYSMKLDNAKRGWLGFFKSLPINAIIDLKINIPQRMLKKARIVVGGSRLSSGFPALIKIDYELGFVLGCLISEGVLSRKTIMFTNNDVDFHKKFSVCFRKAFGTELKNPAAHKSDRCLTTFSGGRGISTLFEIMGIRLGRTKEKEIPHFLFDSQDACIYGFIESYIRGDGHVSDQHFGISTMSEKIPLGIMFLLQRIGVQSSIERNKRGDFGIYVRGESYEKLAKIIKIPIRKKSCKDVLPVRDLLLESLKTSFDKKKFDDPDILRSIFYNIREKGSNPSRNFIRQIMPHLSEEARCTLNLLMESDLDWARVESISNAGFSDRTYDFEVKGKENFIGGYGFVCLHNTLDCDDGCKDDEKAKVPGLEHYFCTKKHGFIPRVLQGLVLKRSELKAEMGKLKPGSAAYRGLYNRQYAMKIIANASYGYYGYAGSRWYSRIAAECITAWGRHYIKGIIGLAQKMGFEVIYGDTDSLFIKVKDAADAKKFLMKANSVLPGVMELDFHGIYKSGLFVPAKTGAAAKKRYALLDSDGKLTIRGFEKVRRDWSDIARDTQEAVLIHILRDKSQKKAVEAVRKAIARLEKGQARMEELVIYTQLTKPLSEYSQIGPHVAAAKKMEKAGIPVGEGSNISYIIVKGEGSISERAEPAEAAKDYHYDPDYYINNQVLPAALRVLSVFGVTEEDILVAPKGKGKQNGKKQASLAGFGKG